MRDNARTMRCQEWHHDIFLSWSSLFAAVKRRSADHQTSWSASHGSCMDGVRAIFSRSFAATYYDSTSCWCSQFSGWLVGWLAGFPSRPSWWSHAWSTSSMAGSHAKGAIISIDRIASSSFPFIPHAPRQLVRFAFLRSFLSALSISRLSLCTVRR
jgi:hypothetical protein